jgi:sugar phosphate isomerase/epimerase
MGIVVVTLGEMMLRLMPVNNLRIEQAFSLVGDHFYQVHVNDNDGKRQQNLVLGDGIFIFKKIFNHLQRIGYEGFVSAELNCGYTMNPQPAVEETNRPLDIWMSR